MAPTWFRAGTGLWASDHWYEHWSLLLVLRTRSTPRQNSQWINGTPQCQQLQGTHSYSRMVKTPNVHLKMPSRTQGVVLPCLDRGSAHCGEGRIRDRALWSPGWRGLWQNTQTWSPGNAAPRLTQVSEQKHLDFHVNGSYSRYLTSFKPADFISLTGFFLSTIRQQ